MYMYMVQSSFFKLQLGLYVLSHFVQAIGLSSVWVQSCFFKLQLCLNVLSHLLQAKGLLPVYFQSCFFKSQLSTNVWSHFLNPNGFLTAYVLTSFLKDLCLNVKCLVTFGASKRPFFNVGSFLTLESTALVNVLSHLVQAKGISPVWL